MSKLVELFCDADDFCRVFIPLWEQQCLEKGSRKRRRSCRMSPSEIMTILIAFHKPDHWHTQEHEGKSPIFMGQADVIKTLYHRDYQ